MKEADNVKRQEPKDEPKYIGFLCISKEEVAKWKEEQLAKEQKE